MCPYVYCFYIQRFDVCMCRYIYVALVCFFCFVFVRKCKNQLKYHWKPKNHSVLPLIFGTVLAVSRNHRLGMAALDGVQLNGGSWNPFQINAICSWSGGIDGTCTEHWCQLRLQRTATVWQPLQCLNQRRREKASPVTEKWQFVTRKTCNYIIADTLMFNSWLNL